MWSDSTTIFALITVTAVLMVFGKEFVSEAGKRPKLGCVNGQLESVMTTIRQVCFDPRDPGHPGVHCWLPGHDNATARNCSTSTRA